MAATSRIHWGMRSLGRRGGPIIWLPDDGPGTGGLSFAMRGVCYSATAGPGGTPMLCAVGPSYSAVSYDGLNWTKTALGGVLNQDWYSVAWSPALGLFLAVSNSNFSMYSTDGVSWTYKGGSPHSLSVCWSPILGIFCAIGYNASSGTIGDPRSNSWSLSTNLGIIFNCVCWSPDQNIFCAVGQNVIYTSTNGVSWSSQTCPAVMWQGVCWSPTAKPDGVTAGCFCAVGINAVVTSPTGTTWTAQTAANNNQWAAVCWNVTGNMFAAVCQTNTSHKDKNAMTSPDGAAWTDETTPDPTYGNVYHAVCEAPDMGLIVAVGEGSHHYSMNRI